MPSSFSYFFLAYNQNKGPLSDWTRKSSNYKIINLKINKGLEKHINILNDSFGKTSDYGLSRVPFSYGSMLSKQTKISYLGEKMILFLRIIKK